MTSMCYKCEKEVEDEEDFAECDSCDSLFHLKCCGVTKKEAKAKKNSKCLKLYCPECFNAKSEATPEKLKEILGLLYKIDLCTQEHKMSIEQKLPASIEQKLNILGNKINSVPVSMNNNNRNAPSTSANVNKRSVKPTVVIKPKTKQQSAKTFDDISKNVQKNEFKVCSTNDGAVVLRCENPTETMKVKQVVIEKLGDNYEVVLPKVKCPRIRITNIDKEIATESILDELKKHNSNIEQIHMQLVTVIPRKRYSAEWNEAVFEVKADAFRQLLDIGVLSLPWRECKIYEHLYLNRCYKCCGFSHKSSICRHGQICSRCAGTHKHSDCKSRQQCCVNCKISNEKYNTKLPTNHHAWNKECPVYKRRLAALSNKIEYNDSE